MMCHVMCPRISRTLDLRFEAGGMPSGGARNALVDVIAAITRIIRLVLCVCRRRRRRRQRRRQQQQQQQQHDWQQLDSIMGRRSAAFLSNSRGDSAANHRPCCPPTLILLTATLHPLSLAVHPHRCRSIPFLSPPPLICHRLVPHAICALPSSLLRIMGRRCSSHTGT